HWPAGGALSIRTRFEEGQRGAGRSSASGNQGVQRAFQLLDRRDLDVRHFVEGTRLLLAVAARAEEDRTHPEDSRRNDVRVDAVADHDAFLGADAELLAGTQKQTDVRLPKSVVGAHLTGLEILPDPQLIEVLDRLCR